MARTLSRSVLAGRRRIRTVIVLGLENRRDEWGRRVEAIPVSRWTVRDGKLRRWREGSLPRLFKYLLELEV